MRFRVIAALSLLFLISAVPAFAQGGTEAGDSSNMGSIAGLLAGGAGPQTLQLKDLDSTWQAFRLSGDASQGNNLLDIYLLLTKRPPNQNTFYTQGKTVTIADQTFLVAYHAKPEALDIRAVVQGGAPPPPSPITPETALSLCLINVRSIGVMNDIQQFDPNQLALAGKAAAQDQQSAISEQQSADAESSLKQLALAMLMYSEDHNERFPPMKTQAAVKKALMRYAKSASVFVDPRGNVPFLPNPRISGMSLADIGAPASTVAFYDPVPDDQGRYFVAFADGHVKAETADQWKKIKSASKIP